MDVLPNALTQQQPPVEQTESAFMDPHTLADHVALLLTATLGARSSEIAFLRTSVTQSRLERYANDATCLVLFIRKDEEIANDDDSKAHYVLENDYQLTQATVASLALIKLVPQLDAHISLDRQVQIINLPGNGTEQSPGAYEALHSLIKLAIAPYFDSFAHSQQPASQTSKTGIPNTRKKLAELELSLLHLQQNTEIPRIVLVPHPTIQKLVNEAAERQTRPSVADLDSAALQDAHFLNAVQATVSTWKRQIHQVTSKERDPTHGTASQEISFWLSLDDVLADIQRQLESPAVLLTTEILQAGRRFGAALNVASDTGIREARDQVWQYTQLMRDFPLDELLSATSLTRVSEAVAHVLNHLSKKLRTVAYPISRALPLVEAISGELTQQLHNLLKGNRLMNSDMATFQSTMDSVEEIFATWDDRLKEFQETARDMLRKRGEKFTAVKTVARHAKVQERLAYIKTFRLTHDQLQSTMGQVLAQQSEHQVDQGEIALGQLDAAKEVADAFHELKDIDVLDVTPAGTELWIAAEAQYNDRIARVENAIIDQLRDRLALAKSAKEMFRVFAKFSALLVRPKIRGAVQEYQKQLLEEVKQDIAQLHRRFQQRYIGSDMQLMDQLRDLPLVCGTITWTRQLSRQLDLYMSKVETVLGDGWHLYADGEKLQAENAHFRKQLDTRPIFEAWLKDVQSREIKLRGSLIRIVRNRAAGNKPELAVNFDTHIVTLFKEVRNLLWLGFQVSHAVISASKDAQRLYPFATSLVETIKTLAQTAIRIEAMPELAKLLAVQQARTHMLLEKGFPLQWENFIGLTSVEGLGYEGHLRESRHIQFVKDLATSSIELQDKSDLLVIAEEELEMHRQSLVTCEYGSSSFRRHLFGLQALVDHLHRAGFSNVGEWVDELNESIETILSERLRQAIQSWLGDTEREASTPSRALTVEIHLNDQIIGMTPPVARVEAHWHDGFQSLVLAVCKQKRLQATTATAASAALVTSDEDTFDQLMYRVVVPELPTVRAKLGSMSATLRNYIDSWLSFQSLWDLQPQTIWDLLGDDLGKWLQVLGDLRKSRSTFDTSTSSATVSGVIVQYGQVQARVNAKFDAWQKAINAEFAVRTAAKMQDLYAALIQMREDLEKQTMDTSSTAAAVEFVIAVQRCKRRIPTWQAELNHLNQGERTLRRQRHQFSSDWLQYSQLETEWDALKEIHGRRALQGEEHAEALRAKLKIEEGLLQTRLDLSLADWAEQKPVTGGTRPEDALVLLQSFKMRLQELSKELGDVEKAKEALDLPVEKHDRLGGAIEELADLQSVWSSTSSIWSGIRELSDTLWPAVVPRKVRSALESLLSSTKDLPSRMRQYAAFEHVQTVLKQYIKACPMLAELKADAVRDRHWARLFKQLKANERYHASTTTLGDVWSLDLAANDKAIRSVLAEAQGELALEEFLDKVKATWNTQVLELVNYQNKCRLIKGWDELLTQCSEQLNSLQAMSQSVFYKQFEEEARLWEDKLNRLHVLFDVWVDVQRQWVYLEGIFSGNADIQRLLPTESGRFQNIDSEFLTIMKKVAKTPVALEVLNIPGALASLERLADLLQKIQKALGEYLERERAQFPRFYFVGDEDLLEILGNSRDLVRVQKHLKKMFAGIASLVLSADSSAVLGFASKEGEQVMLSESISLASEPKINEWLAALEAQMRSSLTLSLHTALLSFESLISDLQADTLMQFLSGSSCQILVLATQCEWTKTVEIALSQTGTFHELITTRNALLEALAALVLGDLSQLERAKAEALITAIVHQRDCIGRLAEAKVAQAQDFSWLRQMRFYPSENTGVQVKMANATFDYGFEYLGVPDRLVQTPLTDRCFLTLTQALEQGLGGSPFGPAGTGKTESVKSLGLQLGRFVLVFCCDDTFDYQAMGRIFLGLCQVGAWGCFDEFNRLQERILSAVSQQIQTIQSGLRSSLNSSVATVSLLGRTVSLNSSTGIFITMNPGYAGRSNLPDNLKKLFRSIAMTHPDRQLIAQVTFFAQGFSSAPSLANRIVPFFDACTQQMSVQAHYDFGLRALKSVLLTCGSIKRRKLAEVSAESVNADWEAELVLQSLSATIAPKLVGQDADILVSISENVFPGVRTVTEDFTALRQAISHSALASHLVPTERWVLKVTQIYQIQSIHHGFMLVGPAATSKSASRRTLLAAMDSMDGVETITYVIDAKVLSKEALYGRLDTTTREWSDGLFTSILRKIVDNFRGEDSRRYWIVFDGDIDPVWVENMNSMLDDNKILTLPTGERLALPDNVRLAFEVESLKHATLATVSRCGMVYFDEQSITVDMQWQAFLESFKSSASDRSVDEELGMQHHMRNLVANCLSAASQGNALHAVLNFASKLTHVMEFTAARVLGNFFGLLQSMCNDLVQWNLAHADFPLSDEQCAPFIEKQFVLSLLWGFGGDCGTDERHELAAFLAEMFPKVCLSAQQSLVNLNVELPSGSWKQWSHKVAVVDIDPSAVYSTDLVIPTTDTVRNEDMLYSWLSQRKPVILCGPPGSGKTMSLTKALNKLPHCEQIGLNFSSASTPELIQRTLEQYCVYRKSPKGVTMLPKNEGQWLVVFCDEINLPARDTYGTQRIISFLRQLIEQSGFWRAADQTWVTIERIQFVGACNPPTDVGRTHFSQRFLRHAPVLMVDYPEAESLSQIYGTFVRAVLKFVPTLKGYSDAITAAMISVFDQSRSHFTASKQSHYIYSPRELSRWMRGIAETLRTAEDMNLEGLVRIWAHEALRLFADRLVTSEEHDWTAQLIRRVAQTHFPNLDEHEALAAPILYSNWLSKEYRSVNVEEMRFYIKARLKTFCEEEVDTALVLYDDAVDHVLRIDRVFRQSQGHLILIGVSGSGKTTLARFVAWMNGLKTYQIKIHRKYSGEDFDDDLRHVLRRCGTNGEKICFILNEANMLESGFLERMNTLLANANVPGLFEGDEYTTLMTACKQGSQREGLMLDSHEELYDWFTKQIARNLHVVFTMNPPQNLSASAATSPALFNRCVLNWLGDWSPTALFQVCFSSMSSLDLEKTDYTLPASAQPHLVTEIPEGSFRHATVSALVSLHLHAIKVNTQHACTSTITPRQFLDLVHQTLSLHEEKRHELEDSQRHLNIGLQKLQSTVAQVARLKKSLAEKRGELAEKNALANEKLQRMVTEQQQAEAEKVALLEIQTDLANTDKNVEAQRRIVVDDLAHAEPAVIEAQYAVSNIKRELLNEVRSLNNPPESVKLAMEAVCVLLGHQVESWRTVQTLMRKDTFIKDILKFDNETQISPELRQTIRSSYMSQPAFQYESVNRASKACGPLVQWVVAQVAYSDILDKVGPLREQVAKLEHEAMMTRKKAAGMSQMIEEVECSILQYKDEYAALISEVQIIKQEMAQVERKVERSTKLLDSLSSEQERWSGSSASFQVRLKTLLGDAMLCAALIAYAGYYDQVKREHLMDGWQQILDSFDIASQHETRVSDMLITPEKRLGWEADGLPSDQLCAENAFILERAQRYPLIIDPSDQAVNFLIKHHKARKLVVTSFLDDSFVKQLETCVRFGNTILIRDAEKLDPIVNKLLNKEYQRTGGRTLVELGKQDVDVSPSFRMYLSTRDSTAVFGPDVCSKVAFVNFTITKSSLRSQSLNKVLLSEQPQIEARLLELVKSQGEYQALLRRLERDLLKALNESTGSILDDDVVIDTLERLKLEAAEIGKKVTEADGVMSELSSVTNKYAPAAETCCLIFAVLEQLATLQHFYQFSLRYFEDILESVLKQGVLGDQDLGERVAHIQQALYQIAYKRVCQSLLHKDHLTLALSLALIAHEHSAPAVKSLLSADDLMAKLPSTVEDVAQALAACKALPYSSRLANAIEQEDIGELLFAETASDKVASLAESGEEWSLLVLVKHVRPDLLTRAAEKVVMQLLQLDTSIVESGLADLVSRLRPSTPIMLASATGYEASFQVDQLVLKHAKVCTSIAMGSAESIVLAERALTTASRTGGWILLKNVHLAAEWLSQLEKRVHALTAHNDFRLFLTTEMSLRVPASLIHNAQVVMCEPPPGMRANLLGSLRTVQGNGRAGQPPAERACLYVLLAWLHAVIQERLRFGKLGWSKAYEFNEADFESGLHVIDAWLQQASSGRSNIAPDKIPWLALQRLLSDSVYGGRIDEQADQAQLDGLVQRLFSAKAYDLDFELVEGERIRLPETSQLDGFMQWITTTLPEHEPPTWLGLQADAERYMLADAGAVTLKQVSLIMDADGLGI